MQSRRDFRPQAAPIGQPLPEMRVSMKVNIVSDGPGGISFSQAVNTPVAYNGFYDQPQIPFDQQQQYAIGYPESSMLPWPADSLKPERNAAEPVVQMPDTSQENVLDSNLATGHAAAMPRVKTADSETENKKRHHYHKHRHHKKDVDNDSVTRSQSASSVTTSVKTSEVIIEKRHRRSKHKSGSGVTDDEHSSASRRSNGERRSVRPSSAHVTSDHVRPEPHRRRQQKPTQGPDDVSGLIASALLGRPSSTSSEPAMVSENRNLDELLREVAINTFADEETKDLRSMPSKSGNTVAFREPQELNHKLSNRHADRERDRTHAMSMNTTAQERFFVSTKDSIRYPFPVDTPVVPKVTVSAAVQADEPFLADRSIQTEDPNRRHRQEKSDRKKKRDKKPTPIAEAAEISPVQDYLRHIAEATAGLIEASRIVLEQRAQTPQLYSMQELELEAVLQPQEQHVRVAKETMIDDPAIPPLSGPGIDVKLAGTSNSPPQDWKDRITRQHTLFEREGKTTDGLHPSQQRQGRPVSSFDASKDRQTQAHPELDRRELTTADIDAAPLSLSGSRESASASSGADRSLEPASRIAQDHQCDQHYRTQERPGSAPGIYYMHTYCAICGSPRMSRRALSGGTTTPTQLHYRSAGASTDNVGQRFLAGSRPSGEDEMDQSPPRRPDRAPPATPLLPSMPQGAHSHGYNGNDHKGPTMVPNLRNPEEICYPTDESHSPHTENVEEYEETRITIIEQERIVTTKDSPEPAIQEPYAMIPSAQIISQWLERSIEGSEPPQPLPKDYMYHNQDSMSTTSDAVTDPRVFNLAGMESEGIESALEPYEDDESRGYLRPDKDVGAAARPRLQELLVASETPPPSVDVGRLLHGFSPESPMATESTNGSMGEFKNQEPAKRVKTETTFTAAIPVVPKIPNGHVPSDHSAQPTIIADLKEALEQRRVQMIRQKEMSSGFNPPRISEESALTPLYEYKQRPEHQSSAGMTEEPCYPETNKTQTTSVRLAGRSPEYEPTSEGQTSRRRVQFEERVEVVAEETATSVQEESGDESDSESTEGDQPQTINREPADRPILAYHSAGQSHDQQLYADDVAQKRLAPSAKIFQIHTKPSSSTSSSDFGRRVPEIVPALDSSKLSVTSDDDEINLSQRAVAGSGGRTRFDDEASSVETTPIRSYYRASAGEEMYHSEDKFMSTPTDDQGVPNEESVVTISSFRTDQIRMTYGDDTLGSAASGNSTQSQRRTNDLYRKALLAQQLQQQGRRDSRPSSRGSSINSERSSISNVMRDRGGGAFTTAELDRFLDDNLSDYVQDRLTPFDEDWNLSTGRNSDFGTRSRDSLASETSYRADVSHDFYSVIPAPDQKSTSSQNSSVRLATRQTPHATVSERSFADIMRERGAVRNPRLLHYANFGNPPPLDRIEEHEHEGIISKGKASSTVTTASGHTLTDSIEREGSGVYGVRPSVGKIQNSAKKSALLTAAVSGRDDAGSSSWVGSELENVDDYSQGRISPMVDVGNDRTGTISSYGELTTDPIRTAQLMTRQYQHDFEKPGFVGYGKAKEKVIPMHRETVSVSSGQASERHGEVKGLLQTDL